MSEIAKKYMPVASGTCIELAYRQVGQYKFDPEKHMHTPVNLHITAADLPELARIIPRLSQAALLWLDRKVQSVDDIRSIQDDLGMTSVFKGNPELLASTYTRSTACATTIRTGGGPWGTIGA